MLVVFTPLSTLTGLFCNNTNGLILQQIGPALRTLTVWSVRNAPSSPDSGSSHENPVNSSKSCFLCRHVSRSLTIGRKGQAFVPLQMWGKLTKVWIRAIYPQHPVHGKSWCGVHHIVQFIGVLFMAQPVIIKEACE